jgi:hypothetical protein
LLVAQHAFSLFGIVTGTSQHPFTILLLCLCLFLLALLCLRLQDLSLSMNQGYYLKMSLLVITFPLHIANNY